jgi:hypothetical protein
MKNPTFADLVAIGWRHRRVVIVLVGRR